MPQGCSPSPCRDRKRAYALSPRGFSGDPSGLGATSSSPKKHPFPSASQALPASGCNPCGSGSSGSSSAPPQASLHLAKAQCRPGGRHDCGATRACLSEGVCVPSSAALGKDPEPCARGAGLFPDSVHARGAVTVCRVYAGSARGPGGDGAFPGGTLWESK